VVPVRDALLDERRLPFLTGDGYGKDSAAGGLRAPPRASESARASQGRAMAPTLVGQKGQCPMEMPPSTGITAPVM